VLFDRSILFALISDKFDIFLTISIAIQALLLLEFSSVHITIVLQTLTTFIYVSLETIEAHISAVHKGFVEEVTR
jgi:hypothetical protein